MAQAFSLFKKRFSFPTLVLVFFFSFLSWQYIQSTHIKLPDEQEPVRFYATQLRDDLKLTLQTSLKQAHHSIFIVIFSLTDRDILQTLKEKADQGCQVTIVNDPNHTPSLKRFFNDNVRILPRKEIKGLMHRKLIVIDDTLVWLGSANLTWESLWMHDNLICGVYCKKMAQAILEKYNTAHLPEHNYSVGEQNIELWFLPEDAEALSRLVQLIQSAKKTIRVAMFTLTHPKLVQTLIESHETGVDVRVAVDYRSSKGASATAVQRLREAGIQVSRNLGQQLLHHKFVYIDQTVLENGSANWTKAAFTHNEDDFAIFSPLSPQQISFMEQLWREIQLFSREELPEEPTLVEALGF